MSLRSGRSVEELCLKEFTPWGFLGVLLIARPWSPGDAQLDLWGVSYMILGSLSIGSSFVYARRFMANLNIAPLALSTYQVGFSLCILAAVTPFSGLSNIGHSAVALTGLVLGLGLTGTGIACVLYYYIVQRMGAVQASTVTYLPPVVALLIGCMFVGEPLRAMDLIAMSAILGGVYAIQTSGSAAKQPALSAPRQRQLLDHAGRAGNPLRAGENDQGGSDQVTRDCRCEGNRERHRRGQ